MGFVNTKLPHFLIQLLMIQRIEKGDIVKVGYPLLRVLNYDQQRLSFTLTGHASDFLMRPAERIYSKYRFYWPAAASPFELEFKEEFIYPWDSLRGVEWSREANAYVHSIEWNRDQIVHFKIALDTEFMKTGAYRLVPIDYFKDLNGRSYSWQSYDLIKQIGILERVAESNFSCGSVYREYLRNGNNTISPDKLTGVVNRLFVQKSRGQGIQYVEKNYHTHVDQTKFLRNAEAVLIAENGVNITIPARHLIKIE